MSLKFRCQSCGKDIIVQFLKVGETAKCKSCDSETVVPETAVETDKEPLYHRSSPTINLRTSQESQRPSRIEEAIQTKLAAAPMSLVWIICILLPLIIAIVAFPHLYKGGMSFEGIPLEHQLWTTVRFLPIWKVNPFASYTEYSRTFWFTQEPLYALYIIKMTVLFCIAAFVISNTKRGKSLAAATKSNLLGSKMRDNTHK